MVDSWLSELLLGDRLLKPSAWHTYLRIFFFLSKTTQIPSVSEKHVHFEVLVSKEL